MLNTILKIFGILYLLPSAIGSVILILFFLAFISFGFIIAVNNIWNSIFHHSGKK